MPPGAVVDPPEPSGSDLRRRALSTANLLWLALVPVALGLAIWRAPLSWPEVWDRVRHARLLPYLAAVAVCYGSFAIRSARWRVLLRNAGERCALAPLMASLLASFAVNCLLPARVGDLFRAYLVRRHLGVPAAKTFGTIVVERVIDLVTVLGLLAVAAALSLHRSAGHSVGVAIATGVTVCTAGIALLLLMRTGGLGRLAGRLPARPRRLYEGFREGSLGALGRWRLVLPMSLAVWALDTLRFALVVSALGGAGGLGPARILLVTLIAALLSTTPLLPGGLGAVESGVVLVLTTVAGLGAGQALSIVLLDRSITYGSVVVSGLASLLALQRFGGRPSAPAGAPSAPRRRQQGRRRRHLQA